MKFSLTSLMNSKCPNIWHEALGLGTLSGATIDLDDETANRLLAGCPEGTKPEPQKDELPPAIAVQPLSKSEWPLPMKALAAFSKPGDKGVGDVIARTVGPIGGDIYKAWHLKVFGKPCKCCERQEALNRIYPLKPEDENR